MVNYNPNNPSSQNNRILAWLKRGKTITPLLALEKFGCLRLSGRIWDLRNLGHNIKTRKKCVGSERKYIAEYYLDA